MSVQSAQRCRSCVSTGRRYLRLEGRRVVSGAVVCSWSLLIRWAQRARCQAETPLIALFRFPRPALSVEQRVPITWTACHIGGHRAWFICSAYSGGRYCGRRVALLYGAGELFACRCCYDLAYASQHEALHHRGLGKTQKIRMQLGGSPNMLEEVPD